jgi:GT2 family glycosyltransferase
MQLSIIAINYNTKDLIVQCINSIPMGLGNTNILSYEIIVVDNVSTDGSVEMIRNTFTTVKIIQNSVNKGYAYAVNRGIEATSGEYLLILNSDIVFTKNCLLPLINYIKENPRTGIVGPQLIYPNGILQRSYGSIPSLSQAFLDVFFIRFIWVQIKNLLKKRLGYNFDLNSKSVSYIDGASMLIRRKVVQEIGYFDERFFFYAEDADFCFRAHKKKWDIMFIPQSQIIHRRGASSVKREQISFSIQLVKANLQFIEKHYNKINLWIYKLLTCFHFFVRFIKNWIQLALFFISGKENKKDQQNKKLEFIKKMITSIFQ